MPTLKGTKHGEFGQCLCNICHGNGNKTVAVTAETIGEAIQNNNQRAPKHLAAMATTPIRTITNNNVNGDCETRQQASQLVNSRTAGLPTATAFRYAAFAPIAPMIPMNYQLPWCYNNNFFMNQPIGSCCEKHAAWLSIRKGRPPHHSLCSNRCATRK